jgi:hypothetical protein
MRANTRHSFVLATVAALLPACKADQCDDPQVCIWTQQEGNVCRRGCTPDGSAGGPGPCPSGLVCTIAEVCCGDMPADKCRSPATPVCCPPSGC